MYSFIQHCGEHDEAVHTVFLCFPEAFQIAILEIVFLSAGAFRDFSCLR